MIREGIIWSLAQRNEGKVEFKCRSKLRENYIFCFKYHKCHVAEGCLKFLNTNMFILYNKPGFSIDAFLSSTTFNRRLDFHDSGFAAGDVIQTLEVDTMGCLMSCLRMESCKSALSLVGSCTILKKKLCTGPLQDNYKKYFLKDGKLNYKCTNNWMAVV